MTGGPCGGKTTGQASLANFFENLGWKVFRVPETATVLMSGGISFGDLTEEQVISRIRGQTEIPQKFLNPDEIFI